MKKHKNQKVIWLINQYAATPSTGMGGRSYYYAAEFAKIGYKVYLISAHFNHKLHQPKEFKGRVNVEMESGIHCIRVKVKKYKNAHSKIRVYNWFIFCFWLWFLVPKYCDKPNYVIYSSPSLVPFIAAKRLAKKYKSALFFEVRDIWPLTLTQIGKFTKKNILIKFLQCIEDYAYRASDKVLSNLPNAVQHMQQRGLNASKFAWLSNGYSEEEYRNKKPLSESLCKLLPKDKFVVGYTGALGAANAMTYLIDAAHLVNNNIAFVIVGDGKEKQSLIKKSEKLKLTNVFFLDPIPKSQIHSLLERFDVCYLGWHNVPLYQFGVATNKLFEYMLSPAPILHSYSGCNDLVREYNCGISVPAERPDEIALAIEKLQNLSESDRKIMGENGIRQVVKNHNYSNLTKNLADLF